MPVWVFTSPSVVMARIPVSQVSLSPAWGIGSQRYWPSEVMSGIGFGALR